MTKDNNEMYYLFFCHQNYDEIEFDKPCLSWGTILDSIPLMAGVTISSRRLRE